MAFNTYLKFENTTLPKPISYSQTLHDVESESSGETEAGTIQRDIARVGVVSIAVSFSVSPEWVKNFSRCAKLSKIPVSYFDTANLELTETEMYMTDYAVKLAHDYPNGGLWTVSFTLKEY